MSDESTPEISCVLPVHDEEGNLHRVEEELLPVLRGLDRPFELILVDDGSTDRTPEILRDLLRRNEQCFAWRLDRNWGVSAALDAGFRAARGEIVVCIDSDFQNDPADIPRLLEVLEEGADFAVGWRRRRRDGPVKRLSSGIANWWRRFRTDDDVHDSTCPLKAFRREVLRNVRLYDGLNRFFPSLVRWEGYRVVEVEVRHRPRVAGRSKYGVWNRLFKGLADLRAVRWMKKNRLRYRAERVE